MTSRGSGDAFFNASMEPPDSLGPKPSSSHSVLIRGNTPAHGLGEPAVKEVEAEISRTTTVRTKKMLSAIKNSTDKVINQERRAIIGATIVLLFSMVLLGGSTMAIVFTRETHVDTNSSGPILVDNNNQVVASGTVVHSTPLHLLPAQEGNDYSSLTVVQVPPSLVGGTTIGFKVVGYAHINQTDMDLFLVSLDSDGLTLHISNGTLTLSEGTPASWFVTYDAPERRRLSMSRGRQLAAPAAWCLANPIACGVAINVISNVVTEAGKWAWGKAFGDDEEKTEPDKEEGGEGEDGKESGEPNSYHGCQCCGARYCNCEAMCR